MTIWLIVGLALLTYASRALALVFLPKPSPPVEAMLRRVPGPLFAGFAAISLVTSSGAATPPATLAAVLAALLVARTRSLLIILSAGLAGYSAAEVIGTLF